MKGYHERIATYIFKAKEKAEDLKQSISFYEGWKSEHWGLDLQLWNFDNSGSSLETQMC